MDTLFIEKENKCEKMKTLHLSIILVVGIIILTTGAMIIINLYWDPTTLQSRNVREYFDKTIIAEIYFSYGLMFMGSLMEFFGYRQLSKQRKKGK